MKLKGAVIVGNSFTENLIGYQVIEDVRDYVDSPCIIVKSLNPDFSIILDRVTLIITENGSALAHLAIIALEYNKTIIRLTEPLNEIPSSGMLYVETKRGCVEIQIK